LHPGRVFVTTTDSLLLWAPRLKPLGPWRRETVLLRAENSRGVPKNSRNCSRNAALPACFGALFGERPAVWVNWQQLLFSSVT